MSILDYLIGQTEPRILCLVYIYREALKIPASLGIWTQTCQVLKNNFGFILNFVTFLDFLCVVTNKQLLAHPEYKFLALTLAEKCFVLNGKIFPFKWAK